MILAEKQQKYQHYCQEKLININVTGEEILPKFTYSPLGKALEKQTKTIEDQGKKQIKTLEGHGKQLIKSSCEKDSLEL